MLFPEFSTVGILIGLSHSYVGPSCICVCHRIKIARTCSNIRSNDAKSRNHLLWNILLSVHVPLRTVDGNKSLYAYVFNSVFEMCIPMYTNTVYKHSPTVDQQKKKTKIFQIKIYKQPKGTFKRQNDLGICTRINSYHSKTRFIHDSTLHSGKFT